MQSYETIRADLTDGVATLTLARPGRLNALIPPVIAEATDAIERFLLAGARVLVITGEGRAFSSGADLHDGLPDDVGEVLEVHVNPFLERLYDLPIPVVSAVNGLAAGAGCGLALAADFVIAARSAYFLLAFVNVGLVPDFGATWILPRLVGKARASEMMMLGERVSAEKAEAWGMIYKSVEDASLTSESWTLAKRLANGPTRAYGMIRKALRRSYDGTFSETIAIERSNQRDAGRTADYREGISAFLAKRAATFTGA